MPHPTICIVPPPCIAPLSPSPCSITRSLTNSFTGPLLRHPLRTPSTFPGAALTPGTFTNALEKCTSLTPCPITHSCPHSLALTLAPQEPLSPPAPSPTLASTILPTPCSLTHFRTPSTFPGAALAPGTFTDALEEFQAAVHLNPTQLIHSVELWCMLLPVPTPPLNLTSCSFTHSLTDPCITNNLTPSTSQGPRSPPALSQTLWMSFRLLCASTPPS